MLPWNLLRLSSAWHYNQNSIGNIANSVYKYFLLNKSFQQDYTQRSYISEESEKSSVQAFFFFFHLFTLSISARSEANLYQLRIETESGTQKYITFYTPKLYRKRVQYVKPYLPHKLYRLHKSYQQYKSSWNCFSHRIWFYSNRERSCVDLVELEIIIFLIMVSIFHIRVWTKIKIERYR